MSYLTQWRNTIIQRENLSSDAKTSYPRQILAIRREKCNPLQKGITQHHGRVSQLKHVLSSTKKVFRGQQRINYWDSVVFANVATLF